MTAERCCRKFKRSAIAPIEVDGWALDAGDVLGWLEAVAGTDEVVRLAVEGELSGDHRLLGAHLPAVLRSRCRLATFR